MKTILVADDQALVRLAVKGILRSKEYEILEVDNGADALALARGHRPDLVLLDVQMPELNGYQVAFALKSDPETCGIPILIMSGSRREDVEGYAEMAGCDGFFEKPMDSRALLDRLTELLGE